MNSDFNQNQTISWSKVVSDSKMNPDDYQTLEKNLKMQFSRQLERILSDHHTVEFLDNKEKYIEDFISALPDKMVQLNLSLKSFKDRFYTCIITDEEVDLLANNEHMNWIEYKYNNGWQLGEVLDIESKTHPDLTTFPNLSKERKKFYREIIYTIPVILNLCGFEVFKPTDQVFIKDQLIESVAKAIHGRFRLMMREMNEKSKVDKIYNRLHIVNEYNKQYFNNDFDQLPENIKSSNLDSAHHISTKLLAIGYSIIEKTGRKEQSLLLLGEDEIETMSKLEHERWAWEKRLQGFTYGEVRNDEIKKHPCLIPYNDLPELEKVKDRSLVKFYPELLDDINYCVVPLSPEQLQNISYIPQQKIMLHESLEKIETSIKTINDEKPTINDEKRLIINDKLNSSIENIRNTAEELQAASQIQNCIMPSRITFRQALPESFILFKPKDILSGDFYFISRIHNFIIMAAADCTGHGTAGAMLSMICSNFLDQAVNINRLTDPSMILDFIYNRLLAFMKRQNKNVVSDYGMEIAVCTIIPESRTVFFAGVNRPLYLYRNNKLEILEPQKLRSGSGYESLLKSVKPSQQLNLTKDDTFYVFSDGYADQFGGKENRKFMIKNFQSLLESIQNKSMIEQYHVLNRTIEEWKGYGTEREIEQTDDILIIGVKV